MCRTIHAVISTVICGIQMLVRVFMTTILMLENVIRMLLQTLYNFISFFLQMISLIPICVVFLLTARLKCFMCGGGGPCPVNRGGACDCLMSLFAIIILFLIFRATGVLDKIFYTIGYAKATSHIARFVPTLGEITECSRNDTDTEYIFYPVETTTEEYEDTTTVRILRAGGAEDYSDSTIFTETVTITVDARSPQPMGTSTIITYMDIVEDMATVYDNNTAEVIMLSDTDNFITPFTDAFSTIVEEHYTQTGKENWTTILYYLV
ncbi:uncharacterized protein LOC126366971 [Pectinophora gossypiella]|uniref:uncharacterized protein LOC126366971 n=1 Tax=Pectinophora gossypiella TaxID=13191 RepID=UPI00214F0D9A|nr:uncharacterized protein LOC126366971 [Pectinophora gossypiella]